MASSNASSTAMLKAGGQGPDWSKSQFMGSATRFHSDSRAKRSHFAIRTIRIAGKATSAAMPDQQVAEQGPLLLWHQFHQCHFNLHRIRFRGESQANGESSHVGGDHD